MKLITVALALTLALPTLSQAQKINKNDDATASDVKVETAAVLPIAFVNGSNGSRKTTKEFLTTILTKAKVDTPSEVKTLTAWEQVNKGEFAAKPELPTPSQMLRLGEKLGTNWVIAASVDFHSRSIWVGLGPKTKSTATINMRIVNVAKEEVALDVKGLKMDDTAKEDTLKAVGALFVSGLFTFVSGGPKTPHEERAAEMGLVKAMEPWLVQRLPKIPKIKKIDAKE